MLSQADNDALCRIGPGTLMGNFFREYWLPALQTYEVPEPDCPPVRIKLLGEELIAFRDTTGAVGLIDNNCPHRRASLFFGRNEESGIRCVYHGWKFDVNGDCVDMPSEPAESNFKDKVKIKAYPTHERNGVIWAYMGPRETPPALPELEGNMHEACFITVLFRNNNWMQGIEGEIDTSASSYTACTPASQLHRLFAIRPRRRRVFKVKEPSATPTHVPGRERQLLLALGHIPRSLLACRPCHVAGGDSSPSPWTTATARVSTAFARDDASVPPAGLRVPQQRTAV